MTVHHQQDPRKEWRILHGNHTQFREGVDYAGKTLEKRWLEWEAEAEIRLQVRNVDFELVDAAMAYLMNVRKESWPALETALAKDPYLVDSLITYMQAYPRSITLRNLIAAGGDASQLTLYAMHCLKKRWRKVEPLVLESAASEQTAVFWDCHFRGEERDSPTIAVSHACDVIGGRWPELEEAMLACRATPMVIKDYAERIIKGRLPEQLHNCMILKSYEDTDNPHVKEYIAKYGV